MEKTHLILKNKEFPAELSRARLLKGDLLKGRIYPCQISSADSAVPLLPSLNKIK